MFAFLQLLGTFVASLFRPRRRLEVENLFLRHQLNIALRGAPHRPILIRPRPFHLVVFQAASVGGLFFLVVLELNLLLLLHRRPHVVALG
jgi:hypothetical protein